MPTYISMIAGDSDGTLFAGAAHAPSGEPKAMMHNDLEQDAFDAPAGGAGQIHARGVAFCAIGAAAVAAALLVAVGGFTWGLPGPKHIQSYHPDEQNVTYSLRNMDPARRDFNPRFWGNPTFYTYQVAAAALGASKAGLLPARFDADYWLAHPEAVRAFYVIGRELSFLYAIASVIAIYCLAKRLSADPSAPVAAAVLLVALPVTAVHCHYMTVNSSAVFWSLMAMLFAVRLQERSLWRNYILAGVFAGFAVSTKFNNAFLPLAIFVAHVASLEKPLSPKAIVSGKLFAAAVATFLAFFAGSPYYILAHGEVQADAHNRMNIGAFWDFSTPPERLLTDFWNHMTASTGWVLAAVFLAVVPLAFVFGPRRKLAPVFAVVFPFLAVSVKSGWWAFPSRMWPMLALMAVITAVMLFEKRRAFVGGLLYPSVLVGLVIAAVWNIAYFNLIRSEHVRTESSRWLEANVPSGSAIVILNTPYYEEPDIVYENALHPEHVRGTRYRIVSLGGEFDALTPELGKWLVVPERYEWSLRDATGMGIKDYAMAHGFESVTSFSRDFEVLGVSLRSWVPADMVQNYPVFIFRRTESLTGIPLEMDLAGALLGRR